MVFQNTEILKNELPLEQESVVFSDDAVTGLVLVDIINGFCTVGSGNLVCLLPTSVLYQIIKSNQVRRRII